MEKLFKALFVADVVVALATFGYGVWVESRLIASIGAVAVVVALLNPSRFLRQWLRRKFISKAPANVKTSVEIPDVRPQPVVPDYSHNPPYYASVRLTQEAPAADDSQFAAKQR